jgi:hypothetical protein
MLTQSTSYVSFIVVRQFSALADVLKCFLPKVSFVVLTVVEIHTSWPIANLPNCQTFNLLTHILASSVASIILLGQPVLCSNSVVKQKVKRNPYLSNSVISGNLFHFSTSVDFNSTLCILKPMNTSQIFFHLNNSASCCRGGGYAVETIVFQ